MTTKFNIQVPEEHYFKNYDDLSRFISYFYQIDLTRKLNPKTILEIGVGNKTVSNYLKQHEYDVTTCDFDKKLEPDYVADIRKLPFEDNSFDVAVACEILEHLPWNDVDKALKELCRITKKYVIISVPYSCSVFELIFKFPLIRTILKRRFIYLFFRIPMFFKKLEFDGLHYWEIGRQNYSISKFRKILRKRFKILKEVAPIFTSHHHFFILEKNRLSEVP